MYLTGTRTYIIIIFLKLLHMLTSLFWSNHTEIRETEAACAISSFYSLVSTCTRFILPVLTSELHSARRMTHHFKHTSEFLGYDHPPSAVAMVPTHTHKHTHTAPNTWQRSTVARWSQVSWHGEARKLQCLKLTVQSPHAKLTLVYWIIWVCALRVNITDKTNLRLHCMKTG